MCGALVVVFLLASLAPLATGSLAAPAAVSGPGAAASSAGLRVAPRLASPYVPLAPDRSVPAAPATAAVQQTALPVQAGWDALHYGTDGGLADPYYPPDVQVAAGPTYVVEMVNLLMGVYTKQGATVSISSLVTLFNSGSDFISDPKIQYDAASARWFASLTDVTSGQVLTAVSYTSDPTGAWHLARIPSTSTGECLDQPILGVGTTTVILSVNVFSQTKNNPCTTPYLGAQYWVVSKTDLMNGAAAPATYASAVDGNEGSIHPVQIEGASADHYMVSTYWPGTATTSDTLHLFTVSGTPPAAVTVTVTSLSMPTAALPPPASQLGTSHTIDTADIRISDAAWEAGTLWLGFDEACLSDATRACIRMVQIDTTAGTILQDFDIDVAGKDVFYPAFRMNETGGLVVVFGYSSSSDYPGILATGRVAGDPPNTLQPPSIVVTGTGPENPSGCSGTCRYGDYFGAGLDPSNGSLVWLAGEFGTASGWSTHVFASGVKLSLVFAYRVVGGGSGYAAPTLSYQVSGAFHTVPLTTVPTAYYPDVGSSWSVTPVLENTTSPGEYWSLNTRSAAQPYTGVANASLALTYTYYHAYSVRLGYDVPGWNTGSALPAASVNATVAGQPVTLPAGQLYVLDAGTTYTYENPLPISNSTDRFMSDGPTTGTVTGVLNLTVHYYHQYQVTFEYSVGAAGAASVPAVTYVRFGTNTSVQPNATVWADAGSAYAYTGSLTSDSGGVRIGAGSGAVGTVSAPGTIRVAYRLQYLLSVGVEPGSLVGSVSGAGWYDAGAAASLVAAAPGGWKFMGWSGGISGSGANVTVPMDAPTNVTALFYPGLTIVAGDGGSVAYAYGTVSGVVAAGSSLTIYAPAGTAVTLTAQPSSATEAFVAWGGGVGGASTTLTFTLNVPLTASAAFGTNVLVVAGIGGGVVAMILAVALLVLVARRRKRPPA